MSVIQFDEPWAVQLKPVGSEEDERITDEVCPLLAVDGNKALVVRQREMMWWPLGLIRVVLQPEVAKPEEEEDPPRVPPDLATV